MFVIFWRGTGWVVIAIIVATFAATSVAVNGWYGEGTIGSSPGAKAAAAAIAAVVLWAFGRWLNREGENPVTGDRPLGEVAPHALYGVPVEYWALPFALIGTILFSMWWAKP